ncbi:MAG: GNAT family N-acetyltransferase [Saprospiraceae bacterium]|nr:GNAT family N-acetyltransferase [Saprospiraceae bacterium]
MSIEIKETKALAQADIIALYESVDWSSAKKPDKLYQGLLNSHSLVTAWDGDRLVGLGNALSDGYLVVYYAHLVVHPDYQGNGVGRMIVERFKEKYGDFHQQILVADGGSIQFYQKCGFERAGDTQPMWIYQGDEH